MYAEAANSGSLTLSPLGSTQSYRATGSAYVSAQGGFSLSIGGDFGLCGKTLGSFGVELGNTLSKKWTMFSKSIGTAALVTAEAAEADPTTSPLLLLSKNATH